MSPLSSGELTVPFILHRDTWVLKIEEASRAYVQARRELYQPSEF